MSKLSRSRNRFTKMGREDQQQIDLTPLLDVVFILLIFFVVTAAFIDERGLQLLYKPGSPQTIEPAEQNNDLVFQIDADNNILLEGRRVDPRSVRANVERRRAGNPDLKVIIDSDSRARSAAYIGLADQARAAGIEDIQLSTH